MKKILDVTKVAFYGATGDDRSPESFPFPACMTSLMETLGEYAPRVKIHAHNREYTKRLLNDQFLAASGMAFGLLWHPEYCMSALDLMQVNDHMDTIKFAFNWAGYDFDAIFDAEDARTRIVSAIDAGVPCLAFGLFDIPECAIIAGYDDNGETLIGWSHFQPKDADALEANGMFRARDWAGTFWLAVVPGAKTGRSLTYADALRNGLEIMQKTGIEGYIAGQAAYDSMASEAGAPHTLSDGGRAARYGYIHSVLFSLAELRCYGANLLNDAGAQDTAKLFSEIHDMCWKADAVCKGQGAGAFKDKQSCDELRQVILDIKSLDKSALDTLRAHVGAN